MADGYRIRSEETWNAARDAYVSGHSAEEVCRRHDIGLSALRRRARLDGWRRADQADPAFRDDDLEVFADLGAEELVQIAWRRMAAAMARGQVDQAAKWKRLHAQLHVQANTDGRAENQELHYLERGMTDLTPRLRSDGGWAIPPRALQNQAAQNPMSANLHELHPGFSPASAEPPLSRQMRRQQERQAAKRC